MMERRVRSTRGIRRGGSPRLAIGLLLTLLLLGFTMNGTPTATNNHVFLVSAAESSSSASPSSPSTSTGDGGVEVALGDASILYIKDEAAGMSDPVNRFKFPPLVEDTYVPARVSASAAYFHRTGETDGAKERAEMAADIADDVDLDLDTDSNAGDENGDDSSSSSSASNYDAEQQQRLVSLLGGEKVVKPNRKVKRQVKAVAKVWADAQRLRDRYENALTDEIPMFPTTTVTVNVSKPAASQETEVAANNKPKENSVADDAAAEQNSTTVSEADTAEDDAEDDGPETETTVTVHAPWWASIVPTSLYSTTVPPLLDYQKQNKLTELLKEAAKASRILKAELQQELLQGSDDEKPLFEILIKQTEDVVPELTKTQKEIEEHKKFHLNTMRALPPVLEAAEKQLTDKQNSAGSKKKSVEGDFGREVNKLRALGKYVSTKVKRGVGADVETLNEMLYLHYSVRGKAAALHQDTGAPKEVDFFKAKSGADDTQFPKTSLHGVSYANTLPLTATYDLVTVQGVVVITLLLGVAGFALPWVLWIAGFVVVICISMWRKNPPKEHHGGGRRLGGDGSEGGDDNKKAQQQQQGGGGGVPLGMIPYHVWQWTTGPLFMLVLQTVLLYFILTVDRKAFLPFKFGAAVSMSTTIFNIRYFFTPVTSMVLVMLSLLGGVFFSRSALTALRRAPKKNGNRKVPVKRTG